MYQRILKDRNDRRATLEAFQEDMAVYTLGTCAAITILVTMFAAFFGVIGQ